MDNETQDIDEQLDELADQLQELHEKNRMRSAVLAGRELRRRARQFQRILPYLRANFHLMNCAQSTFESEFGADIAIESIALLESEETARQIQPDLPQDAYDYFVHWMSACSYDNLAKHVAERQGYNSDGVHDCINDGIQVCRRTGKLQCVTCFREYATDVYEASDDIEMALHHARTVASSQRADSDNDRRWVGTRDTARLLMVSGQLDAALEQALNGLRLVDSYHSPLDALPASLNQIETILWLSGRHDELESLTGAIEVEQQRVEIPEGEDLSGELDSARLAAVAACCAGDFETACQTLSEWDQKLTQLKCLDTWFDVRLQLIASYRLAGNQDRVKALGRQLEAKARPARDWMSLRLLKAMLNDEVPAAPLPFAEAPTCGPFAVDKMSRATGPAETETEVTSTGDVAVQPAAATQAAGTETSGAELSAESPLHEFFAQLQQKFQAAEERDDVRNLLGEVLAIPTNSVSAVTDAEKLIHIAGMLASSGNAPGEVWTWAAGFLAPFGQSAGVVNLVAYLGYSLQNMAEDDAPGLPTAQRIEELFRRSLDMDSDRAGNFARAGDYYISEGQAGDAERCYARGFRLARDNGHIALRLAEIYSNTDRRGDALNALELCLREGCTEPEVAWEAGLTALSLDKHTLAVTCLDQFEEFSPDQAWTCYYRALALLQSGRPSEALRSLDVESERNPDCPFPIAMVRATAAAALEDAAAFRGHLEQVLSLPLSAVDYLTESGLLRLFEMLNTALEILPADDPVRLQFELLALQSGLAPDDYFERFRTGEQEEEVNLFTCEFEQPLGEDWPQSPGCLHGQERWPGYVATWGVLARDAQDAERQARNWQEKCGDASPELIEVALRDEGYVEICGVVWQAPHEPIPNEDDEDDDDVEDGFGDDFDENV